MQTPDFIANQSYRNDIDRSFRAANEFPLSAISFRATARAISVFAIIGVAALALTAAI